MPANNKYLKFPNIADAIKYSFDPASSFLKGVIKILW